MNKELAISPGIQEIAPGWFATIKPVQPINLVSPDGTSYHEATHAVAAILTGSKVLEASRIPGPGYSGITRLDGFNGVAFMAAHAMGCDGTGHDVAVVEWLGHNPDSLAWVARSVLAGRDEEIDAVASAIQARGTISGDEAEEAMDKILNHEIKVEIINPFGEQRHYVTKVREGKGFIIEIPDLTEDQVEVLPQAA